jgi:hypothetical protein
VAETLTPMLMSARTAPEPRSDRAITSGLMDSLVFMLSPRVVGLSAAMVL